MKGASSFDYVIVGSGPAGCVLAERLSADPDVSVLVIESGGRDWNPLLAVPKGFYFLFGKKRHSFRYATTPVGPEDATEYWQRGRVLGGSSSINGLQYERGGRHYWNSVASSTDDEWNWNAILAAYRRLEDHELGESEMRGVGGHLPIAVSREPNALNEAVLQSAAAWGLTRTNDINSLDEGRVGYVPNTRRNGVRFSASRAFLHPAAGRSNLTIACRTHVGWVEFDGSRATGVVARNGNRVVRFAASREVVLCAGAIETPLILERSGVGDGEVLSLLGIPVRVPNPHVGRHLVEQRQLMFQAKVRPGLTRSDHLHSPIGQGIAGVRYLLTRRGVVATGSYDIATLFKSDSTVAAADVMAIFNPVGLNVSPRGIRVAKPPGITAVAYPLHPTSSGTLHCSSRSPDAPPLLRPDYVFTENDQRLFERAFSGVREILAQEPLASLIESEEVPGPGHWTREEIIRHAWSSGRIHHAAGSARMGSDEALSVVDPRLRVWGTENLRVADISVLPFQPGNTMAPAFVIGERAADFIAATWA